MFCTNCGTQAYDGDQFCPGCGARLKHAGQTGASAQQNNYQQSNTSQPQTGSYPSGQYTQPQSKPGNPFIQDEPKKKTGAKSRSMGVIVALLILVVLAMLLFAGARGYMGDDLGDMLSSCGSCAPVGADDQQENDGGIFADISVSDVTTVDAASTTATTTTTTTTAAPTTTSTTVDTLKLEAEEIRELLVSRKWQTELEGYKATVTFNKNGTAAITVKVLFISKTIDAKYSVNDKCHAVIQADYEGQTLGISGQISKVSDTKLVVDRDKNMGEVTLTAA